MAGEWTPISPQGQERIPPWRDGRVLGVIAQVVFVGLMIVVAGWFLGNIATNIESLGRSQFICRDGTFSYRCAYDFMSADAQFDIAEKPIPYTPSDSYWRALGVAALNTAKVVVLGIILTTILGTFVGIARLSQNWLVSNVAKWYVDLFRNTPLVLQLIFIYFSFILILLPNIQEAIQPLGLPIFISQRGLNFAWPVYLPSFATWVAFLVLGLIQAQVLWVALGRREEQTGHESNRVTWVIVSFVAVAIAGWSLAGNTESQSALVSTSIRVREFADFERLVTSRLSGVSQLNDIDRALASGRISQEAVDAAALSICVLRDSASEANFTAQLRSYSIPYTVQRTTRQDQATAAYAEGRCEVYIGTTAVLAAERNVLENSAAHALVPIYEAPMRWSLPRLEGFNFVGGAKMTAEFTAILIGLVLNTGASVAEIVRAGIQSVSKGQSEAAKALGLSESQRLRLVVLPQALRVIIPPMTSQYLNLAKNSTLAQAVAFPDLWTISYTTLNQSGRALQIMLLVMGSYLALSLFISAILNWYNQKTAIVER